nr:hypothetical protein [Tanacetum cinerariifolium]
MSRDVLTVGSTMRISLLYRGEYSQWVERFMNYLEEQTDREAMINSIKNGDQPLPRVTQVSIAGTTSTEQPPLKEKSMWSDQEKRNKNLMDINIDALYNILKQNQGDVNDAMRSKKKTIVDSEGSEADDFNELKKITALLEKAFNRRKFYSKPTNNNLRTSSSSQSANKKQEFVKTDNKRIKKKDDEKKRDISRVKCYNYKKEGHFAKDCKKAKVKDYEYYKTKMLLAKKDKDEQVLLAEDQAWIESCSDSDQEINANMKWVEKANQHSKDFENQNKDLQEKYEVLKNQTTTFEMNNNELNEQMKELIEKNNDLLAQTKIADQQVLYDKMSVQLVELDKHVRDLKNMVLEKDFKISELEECVRNKDLEIEKCLERLNVYENNLHKMDQTNQTVHMIIPSKDNLYNGRKGIGSENPSYFKKAKDLRPTLYDEKVIGLGYTSMFLTHSNEALEFEKFKRSRENKIEFAYDYGNLNAIYVNEKINLEDDYFQEIINLDFDKIDSLFQQTISLKPYVPNVILEKIIIDLEDEVVNLLEKEKVNLETIESLKLKGFESSETVISELENQNENDPLMVEKECNKVENSKVIAPGMFKLNVSQCISPISMSKSSCESINVEIKLKRKRHLDTFSSVRRPKNSGVIWKKKVSSNTSNVGLFAVSVSNLNKNVKRYSRKDLLACNNSHLGETSSAYMCNDVRNVSCNTRLYNVIDDNNFFIFDDVNVRISLVSKMPFRK